MLRVRVPATSANLGPGFDALGLAVSLYLEVQAEASASDHLFYQGEGFVPDSPDNLIHQGFQAAFHKLGRAAPKMTFYVGNPIPLARGLGSSSAALVAGIALADAHMDGALGREEVFQLAARLEGHPDNVAPAVFGGFTVSALQDNERYLCRSLPLPASWQLIFAVPDFQLLTSEARAALPTKYTRADVVFSTSRAALWSLAITLNEPEILRVASQDVIHEPYREALVPGLARCRQEVLAAGAYAAFLSGAGPTVGIVCQPQVQTACTEVLRRFVGSAGQLLELQASMGYTLSEAASAPPPA